MLESEIDLLELECYQRDNKINNRDRIKQGNQVLEKEKIKAKSKTALAAYTIVSFDYY